ncbi:sensor histidine kinase [Acidovorax sp. FG27]
MPPYPSLLALVCLRLRVLRFLALALAAAVMATHPAHAVVLDASDGLEAPKDLAGALWMHTDPSGAQTLEDMVHGPRKDSFVHLPGAVEQSFTRETVWVRFTLQRTPDSRAGWLLRLRPPRINHATLYAPDGHGGYAETRLGDRQPFTGRAVPDHNFVFPIDVAPEPRAYYLKLSNAGAPLRAEIDVWQAAGFDRFQKRDYTAIGVLLGAALLSVCMNLVFMSWLRDTLYGHYALYVIAVAGLAMARLGYLAEWALDTRPDLVAQAVLAVNCLFNTVATWFMARLFGFRRHWPPAFRGFMAVAAFNLMAFVLALTPLHVPIGPGVSLMATASTVFGAAFVLYLIAVRRLVQYLLPAAAFSVGTLIGLYNLVKVWLGDALPGAAPEHLYLLGVLAHLILLNVAVADRTRRAEREVLRQRELALSARVAAEQALESTVARRTAELAGTNAALRDEIGKRGRLETRLRQSLEDTRRMADQQQEFVSMVSHEFRTPLAVIDAAAQSLDLSRFGGESAVRRRTERIRRSVLRLSLLIENILMADRLRLDERSLRLQSLDLQAVLLQLCQGFNQAGAERLQLTTQGALEVVADRALIEIALQNLMHNALKYSPAESSVSITLTRAGDTARIDVADRGPGVPAADVRQIFEKYFRSDTVATVAGSGLGLHLAREIARRHGGDVLLVANSPQGATFRLVLPIFGPAPEKR